MSRVKRNIELVHPSHMRKPGKELLVSAGHVCSYCQGNGWFWGKDDAGEEVKIPCPMCGGSGEVDAVVTVEWKASNKQ